MEMPNLFAYPPPRHDDTLAPPVPKLASAYPAYCKLCRARGYMPQPFEPYGNDRDNTRQAKLDAENNLNPVD